MEQPLSSLESILTGDVVDDGGGKPADQLSSALRATRNKPNHGKLLVELHRFLPLDDMLRNSTFTRFRDQARLERGLKGSLNCSRAGLVQGFGVYGGFEPGRHIGMALWRPTYLEPTFPLLSAEPQISVFKYSADIFISSCLFSFTYKMFGSRCRSLANAARDNV